MDGKDPPEGERDRSVLRAGFSERLAKALDHAGFKPHGRQNRLKELMGVSSTAVSKWLGGTTMPKSDKIVELATLLGVRSDWLITGQGDMTAGPGISFVSLISWDDIDRWLNPKIRKKVPVVREIPFPGQTSGDAFCVPMVGTSMEPAIADGDLVIVDPGRPYKHQSFVLVSSGPHTETVRKVLMDGGAAYLVLLNPDPPRKASDDEQKILGTVIGKLQIY